ncbi:MAG: TetR/AcrR family transcriptional regulator, partial [Acholeplasmatales bacterium]
NMPKAFSELEKSKIKDKLLEVTKHHLKKRGFKRTTVDDLVRETQISKGTFYLFYDSKEHLIYDVFRFHHDQMQDDFIEQIKAMSGKVDVEVLTKAIVEMVRTMDQSFLFGFIASGDLEAVMRKLPESYVLSHRDRDELMMMELMKLFPDSNMERIAVFSAAMRMALMSLLHKKDIGEALFDEALNMVLKGIVKQMIEVDNND